MLGGNEYLTEILVRDRQAHARQFAAERAARRVLRGPPPPLRVRLGLSLIRVGRWLLRHGGSWAVERRRLA